MELEILIIIPSISHIIETILVTPFETYLTNEKKNNLKIQMRKIFMTHLNGKSTAEASYAIDDEPLANRALL